MTENIPSKCISVQHGTLTISVPRDIFIGAEAVIDEKKAAEFKDMIGKRYPWLNEKSLDVLMKHAREKMLSTLDEETSGRSTSKTMAKNGNIESAIKHLQEHLERNPDNASAWYDLGELLCKVGRVDEGYKAINRGRSLIDKK